MKEVRGEAQARRGRLPARQGTEAGGRLAQVWEEVVAQAAKTPWVVRAVRAQGREMASRVVAQYLRGRRLPRRMRRALARRGALGLASMALLMAVGGPEVGW